ncbi:hypothetical protein C0991_011236 [Blastosporella zonata]|nr:hypothetical protein C0991_011236 [Blastosporella zonata]
MFFAKVSLVTALLATFASHVACGPAETNGQRMARGLPPLPPKRRDRQPTPAWGIGGLSLSRDDGDLKVSFSVPQTGSIPFDILATNPVFSEPFYVGAAGTLDIDSLDLTSQK